ncbi:FBP domain-containing protein [Nocardia otitidiscaviarum]|uniref:FBP domain-containing protein n=1 Tax=Nocardia otitidiscaviarum TaxID=1823 RepID=UPI00189497F9|nr:FBP domain-containing protein [Nocardia otitidiscaviarum]MBF6235517.1 FBP domain-containing protein [Nocardia otitidiscaviarum]
MRDSTRDDIAHCFVNSSRSVIRTMTFPRDFDDLPWPELDYLGWTDPRAPRRAYLVAEHTGRLVGIELRAANTDGVRPRTGMCELCHAVHRVGGTNLFTARKAGAAGKAGNSVGTYVCADFCCSLYVRGRKPLGANQPEQALPTEARIEHLTRRLDGFVARVLG